LGRFAAPLLQAGHHRRPHPRISRGAHRPRRRANSGHGDMTVETPRPRFGLQWGIKSSFLDYVTRMPDGRALAGAGVTVNERGELVFPFDEEATSSPETFAFGGDVRFSGHFGLLFVQIALPHIVVRDGVGEMTVLDPGSKDGT